MHLCRYTWIIISFLIMTMYYDERKLGKGDDAIIMNIGKMSTLSTQSMRPHYEVGRGSSSDDRLYTVVADMMQ